MSSRGGLKNRKTVVGVMGPGAGARPQDIEHAGELGRLIAENGWVTLNGGRNTGVMDAVSRGAHDAGGLVIGVLPGSDQQSISGSVDIAIITGMGQARNNINILSSDVVVACGMGLGTSSEIALALKAGKNVILLGVNAGTVRFFSRLAPQSCDSAASPAEVIEKIRSIV